jgi:hypothetical protein
VNAQKEREIPGQYRTSCISFRHFPHDQPMMPLGVSISFTDGYIEAFHADMSAIIDG